MKHSVIFKTAFLCFFLLSQISCETDESTPDIGEEEEMTDESLDLLITTESAQDQMGDFESVAMAVFNDKVWSVAGANDSSSGAPSNQVWFSENGVAWVSTAVDAFEAREGHTLTVFDNKMWLIAGERADGSNLGDIHTTEDGENWVQQTDLAPFGPTARHSTIVFNGRMYVIGASMVAPTNNWVWSTANGTDWTEETNSAFPLRIGHEAIVLQGAIYVIGGTTAPGVYTNEIWSSVNGRDWTQVTTEGTLFSARDRHTVTSYQNKAFLLGGRSVVNGYNRDIWYSDDMITWMEYTDDDRIPGVNSHAALVFDTKLWHYGGRLSTGNSGAIHTLKLDE